jgi:hypothetical protein
MGSLRDFDLAKLQERFRLRVLVETGTGEGHSLKYAASAAHWDAIHSIEVDPKMVEAIWRTIPPRSILWEGRSVDKLPEVLAQIAGKGPALFWLDAHFPGSCSGAPLDAEPDLMVRLPLDDELEVIVENRKPEELASDLFIIDDAWIYRDGIAGCGDFDRRREVADVGNDLFIHQWLSKTHLILQDPRANGYTIAIPKLAARYVLEDCLGSETSAKLRAF